MRFPSAVRQAGLVVAVAALALSAGCAKKDDSEVQASGVKLVEAGKLTVCTHLPYPPFQSKDASGKVIGFDVDDHRPGRQGAGCRADDRRHAVRGHQVRRGPQHRQVRRRRRRHDDHRGAQEGDRLLRPVLRRHPGAAGQDRQDVQVARRPQGQEARRPGAHHRRDYAKKPRREGPAARRVRGPRRPAAGPRHRPGRGRHQRPAGLDRVPQGATRARSRWPPSSTPASSTASR